MQSGKERKSFSLTGPAPGNSKPKIIAASKPKPKAKVERAKSILAITGLATDALNTTVVASTLEGKLYVRIAPCRFASCQGGAELELFPLLPCRAVPLTNRVVLRFSQHVAGAGDPARVVRDGAEPEPG